jgi:hypothetical protein
VAEWNTAAAISKRITGDVQRTAAAVPRGSLLVIGAPDQGVRGVGPTWLWAFALPFALQPPFTPTDLTDHAFAIMPPNVYCCPRQQWLVHTRRAVASWAALPEQPPAVAMVWAASTGALARQTEADNPALRPRLLRLSTARTPTEGCEMLIEVLDAVGGEKKMTCRPLSWMQDY